MKLWPSTRKYNDNDQVVSLRGRLKMKQVTLKYPAAFDKAAERVALEETEKRGYSIGKGYVIGTAATGIESYPNLFTYYRQNVKEELAKERL